MKGIFSSIAGRYDRMNRIMSLNLDRRWRSRALDAVHPPEDGSAVDLACGTGDFAIELLRRFPRLSVTGVDLTPEMLAVARRKCAGAGAAVRFVEGDAQRLSAIADASADLVVCAFGFRNFPDKAKALAECRRALRPSGELLVLELFRPGSRAVGALVSLWLALVARVFCRGRARQYAYLRDSIARTASPEEFAAMAEAAGFSPARRMDFLPSATALAFRVAPPGRA